jgi:chromosome segregation ATPase
VATPEPLEPSRRLSEAALAERERLLRRLEQVEERRSKLAAQLQEIEAERERVSARLTLLDELLPAAPPEAARPRATGADEPARGYLRGAAIRREAIRQLAASERAHSPVHYTDWLRLLLDAGYGIAGQDAAASFLTQITRSPLVRRGDDPGVYLLDQDAPARLRARLDELHRELLALHDGQQTLEAIVSTRERRDELVTEVARIERALEEALGVLNTLPGADA